MDGSIVLGPATCNVDVDVDVDVDVMSMIPFLVWRCMAVECMARMEEGSRHCPHEEVEGTRTGSTRLCMHYAVCIQCNCRESLNNGRSTSLGTAPARSTSTRCLLLSTFCPFLSQPIRPTRLHHATHVTRTVRRETDPLHSPSRQMSDYTVNGTSRRRLSDPRCAAFGRTSLPRWLRTTVQ